MDLYEYQETELPKELENSEKLKAFQSFLDDVWNKYKEEKPKNWREYFEEDDDTEKIINRKHQPFLSFYNDTFKSKNFVGFIKFEDISLNLYPKICIDKEPNDTTNMLLLWLRYSQNIFLPNYENNLDEYSCNDFFECLIYLFAKYTNQLFSNSLYQHYEEISEETNFLKGKLNFNEYIKNIAKGKQHKFFCTYDSFEFNNKFNQIVKYTAKMLYHLSNDNNNKALLTDILFVLDEVDDCVCTYNDCKTIYINRFLEDFNTVLDYCKLFLKNCVSFNTSGDFSTFAFLLRTEKLFEDFITYFAKEKNTKYDIIPQSPKNLDKDGKFHIKPDIIVKEKDTDNIIKIIDIKYKIISNHKDISYHDLYQCVTYAKKLNCNDITLVYPKVEIDFLKEIKIDEITINFAFVDSFYKTDYRNNENYENAVFKQIIDVF